MTAEQFRDVRVQNMRFNGEFELELPSGDTYTVDLQDVLYIEREHLQDVSRRAQEWIGSVIQEGKEHGNPRPFIAEVNTRQERLVSLEAEPTAVDEKMESSLTDAVLAEFVMVKGVRVRR